MLFGLCIFGAFIAGWMWAEIRLTCRMLMLSRLGNLMARASIAVIVGAEAAGITGPAVDEARQTIYDWMRETK